MASLLIAGRSNGQFYFTVKKGKIVYTSSSIDADSTIEYIENYYHGKHLPFVYLIISSPKIDTSKYELADDNLSGYPSNYKYYRADKSFNQQGIKIKIYANRDEPENFLRLLSYGINNLKEIKRQRKFLMKQDNDIVNILSLNQNKII